MNTVIMALPIVGVIAGLSGLFFAFWVYQQTLIHSKATQKKLARLADQNALMTTGAIGLGQRLLALEGKLQTLRREYTQESHEEAYPYAQAMQMFDHGADASTVAASCGLSSSEVNLMALIRRQVRQRQPVDEALVN